MKVRTKQICRSERTRWARQLEEAQERAIEKRVKLTKKNQGRPATQKEFDEFCVFEQRLGARQTLIDLLNDEGTLDESLQIMVEYYLAGD